MKECKSLHKVYNKPVKESVQILRKLDVLDINILQCKVELDFIVSYYKYDGVGNYIFGPMTIQSNVVHTLTGESCLKLHNGIEAETTIEGELVKISMQEGRTQMTYFMETKDEQVLLFCIAIQY